MDPDLAACFEERRAQLHDVARAIVGSRADADDVLQDAWLKASRGADEAIRSPAAWMTTIVRNLALDRLRHRLVADRFASEDVEGRHERSVEEALAERLECAAIVRRIVERLEPADAAALLLRVAFDEDAAALAKRSGRSVGAMRVALHRAGERVRERADARRRAVDPDDLDAVFVACWHAIAMRDPAPLYAALAPGTATLAAPAATTLAAPSQGRTPAVRVGFAQVGGRTVLVWRQERRLICVVPVGEAGTVVCIDD